MLVGLLLFLAALLILDAFRLRKRISGWHLISEESREGELPCKVLTAPGLELDSRDIRRVQQWMEVEKVDAVDLIPWELDALQAFSLAMFYDPENYREMPFQRGRSALHALVIREEVGAKAGIASGTAANPAVLARATHQVKRFAPRSTELAILRPLRGQEEALAWRRQVMKEAFGGEATTLFYGGPVIYLFILASLLHSWGWLLVVSYHLQPLIALLGQNLKVRQLLWVSLLRLPLELYRWWGAFRTMKTPTSRREQLLDELRPVYAELATKSVDTLFQARRTRCPLCKSESLTNMLETPDLYQGKPGAFRLDECEQCGHIFQNPQLSLDGLSYYYKDFYDGLGEDMLESIFDSAGNPYDARGQFTLQFVEEKPDRWLDVGAGHGHFCLWMKGECKDTAFEALDLGDSIHGALERGWVDRAHQGLFTGLADDLRESFDVVSMSHYLEHTPNPVDEIRAAATVLKPGGVVFIEIPDPESKLGRLLGRYWLPWFQPQHLHFLSVTNVSRVLEDNGFRVAGFERGPAHQAVDFSAAWMLILNRIFPDRTLPWHRPFRSFEKPLRTLVWSLGLIPLGLFKGCDVILSPLLSRPGWSNTFRVAAVRDETDVG